jgi:hypothetical protein
MPRTAFTFPERAATSAFGVTLGALNARFDATSSSTFRGGGVTAERLDTGLDAGFGGVGGPFGFGRPTALPDLAAGGRVTADDGGATPGSDLTLEVTTRNDGDGDAPRDYELTYYLSDDTALDPEDIRLGGDRERALEAGESDSERFSFELPPTAGTGRQFILVDTDPADRIPESDETNNLTPIGFDVNALNQPDLVSTGRIAEAARGPVESGSGLSLDVQITNRGDRATDSSIGLRYALSHDRDLDAFDIPLGDDRQSALDAGETGTESATLSLPDDLVPGRYFVLIETDAGGAVAERHEFNNETAIPIDVITEGRAKPDLVSSATVEPEDDVIAPGAELEVEVITRNEGNGEAGTGFDIGVFFSDDPELDAGDRFLGDDRQGELDPGEADDADIDVRLPGDLDPQDRFLLIATDIDGEVREADEGNNVAAIALDTAGASARADLTPSITVSETETRGEDGAFVPGEGIPITGSLTNQGAAPTESDTVTRFYLSRDQTIDESFDFALGTRTVGDLAPGESAPLATQVFVPDTAGGGEFFILAEADADGDVAEADEGNNVAPAPIRIDAGLDADLL